MSTLAGHGRFAGAVREGEWREDYDEGRDPDGTAINTGLGSASGGSVWE